MMTSRRIIIKVIIILLVFGVAGVVSAQSTTDTAIHNVDITVNQVAKIGLNDATALALSITDPTGAGGNNPDGDTGQRKLQYTNVVLSAATRRITIESDIGVPAGTNLGANISAITGTGCGTAGSVAAVSTTAQDLITAIGSCATGTGANGATLDYTLSVTAVENLVANATATTLQITFTLLDT